MSKQNQNTPTFDWSLVFYWMMATTSGWLFGWLLLPTIALVTAGVGAGLVQWAVLYRRMPKAWRWILATAIGWLIGLAIIIPVVPAGMGVLSGMVIGAAVGTAQWLLLRRQVHWAGWWIPVSALAWATSLSLAPASSSIVLPRILLAGVMPSVMTGVTLGLLVQQPKLADNEKGDTN
jgi:hypothetical protein